MPPIQRLVALFVLTLVACTRTETNTSSPLSAPVPQDESVVLRDLSGLWLVESGRMMSDFIGGLATFGVTADVTALQINADGSGRVWLRDRLTDARDCVRAFVIFDDTDGTLVFDFTAEPTPDFVFNLAVNQTSYVYPVVTVENGWLGLGDPEGQIAILSSQVALPGNVTCLDLPVVAQYDVPAPQFFGDLVHYGDDLIFNGSVSGQIEAFSLSTRTLGAPLGPTSSRLVQTAEEGFFWTHCGCGGSRDAFKRTLTMLFDTVSSEDEMGEPITFRAMAYLPTTDRLWIHGRPFDSQFGRFFVLDTNGEPDVVENELSFNRDLRALAYDGTDLWGIATVATQIVVRIDVSTGKVFQSYELPNEDVSWSGLEIVNGAIYMLGTDLDGDGVLYELGVPVSVPASAASMSAPGPTGALRSARGSG